MMAMSARPDGDDHEVNPLKAAAPYQGYPCLRCGEPTDAVGSLSRVWGAPVHVYECERCDARQDDWRIERDAPWRKDVLTVDGEACPDCDGRLMWPLADDDHRDVRLRCIDCPTLVYDPAEGGEPEPEPIRVPEWVPTLREGYCWDCLRSEGVDPRWRRTWGIYPQDIRRVRRMPRLCDDCWGWREDLAPRKPTADEIGERRRVVNDR